MIPRRLFWALDLATLFAAFSFAYLGARRIYNLAAPLLDPTLGALVPASWRAALPYPWYLPPITELLWTFPLLAGTALVTLSALGNYRPLLQQSTTRILAGALVAPLSGLGLVALVLLAFRSTDSNRLFFATFATTSSIALASSRLLLQAYFRRRQAAGYYAKSVLLIGEHEGLSWLARYLDENTSPTEYRVLGYLRVQPDQPELVVNGSTVPCLGSVDDLETVLISKPTHQVFVMHPQSGGDWVGRVIRACDYLGVLLWVIPEALVTTERHSLRLLYHNEPLHLPAVILQPPRFNSEDLFLKRVFDIVVASFLLIILSPVFLLTAILIKITTPHLPVFYPWNVVGQNGVRFRSWKFTTMTAGDEMKEKLADLNEMTGPVFKIKNDPRVTPLGKWLRKFDINELPQLVSVLQGHMSLVGPRPAGPHELERYEFWHKRKLSIRPGITCLWQVRGRNRISNFDDWVRMDLEYIDNWSLWLDLKILLRTVFVVLRGTGS
jgi:exopolysaccharide biosynthesis polyprenyl glycosylphosphotransferase